MHLLPAKFFDDTVTRAICLDVRRNHTLDLPGSGAIMTDAAISNQVVTDTTRRKIWPTLALGLLGGLALGVVARFWMRLIADDPAVTWNGTVFIVVGFMTFGMAQSIAAVARQRATRRWTLTTARVFGGVGILPLFVAAGGVMAPPSSLGAWQLLVRIGPEVHEPHAH